MLCFLESNFAISKRAATLDISSRFYGSSICLNHRALGGQKTIEHALLCLDMRI